METKQSEHSPKPIDDERSYQQTLSVLSKQEKPSKILCMLMNMLESYRQAKKMGWSRSWNKYGLTTFQSFKLDPQHDEYLSKHALACLNLLEEAPLEAVDFADHLLSNPKCLMGFLFFSEYVEDGQRYETATLSFGRKVQGNLRFRDRVDLVFDAPVHGGELQPLERVRIYIDPYQQGKKEPLWSTTLAPTDGLSDLFTQLCQLSWEWETRQEKHWDHWTSRYIDYFGARSSLPSYSHFYLAKGQRFLDVTTHS